MSIMNNFVSVYILELFSVRYGQKLFSFVLNFVALFSSVLSKNGCRYNFSVFPNQIIG